jgi:hypothetical protein
MAGIKLKALFQFGQQFVAGGLDPPGFDGGQIGLGKARKGSDFIQCKMKLLPLVSYNLT